MSDYVQETPAAKRPMRALTRRFSSFLPLLIAGFLIFGFGYGLGDGRIKLNFFTDNPTTVNNQLPEDLDYSAVEQVYDSLRENFDGQLDIEKLLEGLKQGLAEASGDPYTAYLDKEESEDFAEELNGCFEGIGAVLGKDDDNIVIVAPLDGSAAAKAGLRTKDVVLEIDGERAFGLSIDEAVNKIRGDENTKVTLTILRGSERLEIEIIRQRVCVPSVESKILEGNVGYMKISRFGDDTVELAQKAARQFRDANVTGVVLDMRSNPGGLLDAAVDLSSIWLEQGDTVLEEKRADVVVRSFRAKGSPVLGGVKTVVLIDEGSASASEITAGALKDNDAATLFGAKTYGKGSVQRLIDFGDGTQLKVTIARWFTPDGKNIDQEGIAPDQEVERGSEDSETGKDAQLDAALDFIRK